MSCYHRPFYRLLIPALFDHEVEVFKGRDYPQNKEDKEEPRLCVKSFVQIITYQGPEGDGNGHGHANGTQIAQGPEHLLGFIIH